MVHGIPSAKVQRAERNKITQPHQIQLSTERPHPRATRQHKIPWCGLAVVIIMEKTILTGSPRRLTACWGSCDAILGHAKKIPKPTPILPWSDQIWSIAHRYGTHIIKIKYTRWKWSREGQQGLPRTGIEIPAVFPPCWTIFSGSH